MNNGSRIALVITGTIASLIAMPSWPAAASLYGATRRRTTTVI